MVPSAGIGAAVAMALHPCLEAPCHGFAEPTGSWGVARLRESGEGSPRDLVSQSLSSCPHGTCVRAVPVLGALRHLPLTPWARIRSGCHTVPGLGSFLCFTHEKGWTDPEDVFAEYCGIPQVPFQDPKNRARPLTVSEHLGDLGPSVLSFTDGETEASEITVLHQW